MIIHTNHHIEWERELLVNNNNSNNSVAHTVLAYATRLYYMYIFKANEIQTLIANANEQKNIEEEETKWKITTT